MVASVDKSMYIPGTSHTVPSFPSLARMRGIFGLAQGTGFNIGYGAALGRLNPTAESLREARSH